MRAIASRAPRAWFAGPGIALLLVVAVVLGVLHTALPLHLHHGATSGLYNEEHVLATLDSAAGDAPLPAAPALRTTRSRAPPLA